MPMREMMLSVALGILLIVGSAAGIWYITTYPVSEAVDSLRAERLGNAVGVTGGVGFVLIWWRTVVDSFRSRSRR